MKWTPINKKPPKEYKRVLVSFYEDDNYNGVNVAMLINGQWYLRLGESPISLPINAWMPLPKAYKGD